MIDFIVKYTKILLVYALSAVQTVFGWGLLSLWINDSQSMSIGSFIIGALVLVGTCLLVLKLRVGEISYLFWAIIFEVALSPFAVFRTIISFLAWIFRREAPELDFDFCDGFWELIWCYLFYIG